MIDKDLWTDMYEAPTLCRYSCTIEEMLDGGQYVKVDQGWLLQGADSGPESRVVRPSVDYNIIYNHNFIDLM